MIPDDPRKFVRPPVRYPGVSFVIPAHNESKCLKATLETLIAAANELEIRHEIIVVNDASTDNTAEIAREVGVIVVDVRLRNIGAVRNAGAEAARYPWLVFQDADTIVPARTIAQSLKALQGGCVGGGAHVELDIADGIPWSKLWIFYAVSLAWLTMGRWAAGCYMFCRRDVFESFGGFDESYFACEEYFFSRQLKARGRFQLVRPAVQTSSRKFHGYSTLELLRFLTLPFLNSAAKFRSQVGLELLYQDNR